MWSLDPHRHHLNHGSFGAVPTKVLETQQQWVRKLEANPTSFMMSELPIALDRAREAVAGFVGADPAGIVFVPNASTGVAAVLRSIEPQLAPGDEVVTTAHDYNAVRQMLVYMAERTGAQVVVAQAPFPVASPGEVEDSVLAAVSDRTRLVVVDHITSPTGLVFPIDSIVARLEPDIPVLVDGAHGPGQVPLGLDGMGASWYTGNLHKWVCAPKGAGFLHTRADRRDMTVPTVISHGFNAALAEGSSRYHALFDWTGTDDFSPYLSAPAALEAVAGADPSGWDGVMRRNHELALAARSGLARMVGADLPAPDSMVGSMAAIQLPDATTPDPGGDLSPLMTVLDEEGFEVIVIHWPRWPRQLLRVSAYLYNDIEEYQELGKALQQVL
jgi:isopenicillin-N epimerase